MWALFSYDVMVGTASTIDVRQQIVDKLTALPDNQKRDFCELLEDTFMCHVDNSDDFERLNNRLSALRLQLQQQFNYAFSLNRANDPLVVRGPHDVATKNGIRTS